MDPATLYMLLHYTNGYQRVVTVQTGPMVRCEEFFADVAKKAPPNIEIKQHTCWPQGKSPPEWVSQVPTVGVPVLQEDLLR